MSKTNFKDLLEAGVHFGHLTRKWNPKMAPYHLYGEKWNPRYRLKQNSS